MKTLPETFWAKVDKTPTCWLWTATKGVTGYGRFSARGIGFGTVLAHRIAWESEFGPVPADLELDHLCNTRACVRPSHLEPVTHAENVRRTAQRRTHCDYGHALVATTKCLECRRRNTRAAKRRSRGSSTWAARQWATANGYAVGSRGRLPTAILAAYADTKTPAESENPRSDSAA